jgi:ribosome-associated toxin RatA of RatAB toxin-antitoxin module
LKRVLKILILFLFCEKSHGAEAQFPDFQIPKVREIFDENVSRMLERGNLIIVHKKPSPELPLFVSAGTLINAPVEKVWNVITDFEKYPEFVPQVDEVKTKKIGEKEIAVTYNLSFRFTVIKIKVQYTVLMRLSPPTDIWWSLKKDEKNDLEEAMGRWELIPVGKNKTAAFYTIYSHLQSMGRLMRFFLKQEPHLETTIPVSTGSLMVDAMKKRVEEGYTKEK